MCRPLTGARIETSPFPPSASPRARVSPPHGGADRNCEVNRDRLTGGGSVAPSRGRGSKRAPRGCNRPNPQVSPPHGGADRNYEIRDPGVSRPRVSPPHGGADRNAVAVLPIDRHSGCRPLTGARIETLGRIGQISAGGVVSPPHGGADRNLWRCCGWQGCPRVAPSRGRGSKPRWRFAPAHRGRVSPPHGGADRNERAGDLTMCEQVVSPPHGGADRNLDDICHCRSFLPCRPLTGARIETPDCCAAARAPVCRPLTGARIETGPCSDNHAPADVAPSRGRGSKPPCRTLQPRGHQSPPHGGVDQLVGDPLPKPEHAFPTFTTAQIEAVTPS